MKNICNNIKDLIEYALKCDLICENDIVYTTNLLCSALGINEYAPSPDVQSETELEKILTDILDYAADNGILEQNSVVFRDLFDTKIMGMLTPRPSEVIARFNSLYNEDPEKATDYFYGLACNSDYIRRYRICKDLKWKTPSEYGDIDITVNLSKPEKDPKAIAAAKLLPQSGYPKCRLCHENEGFAGNASMPARQTLRQIPITMDGKLWYLQYSPYVYYNEHCIALSSEHSPMKIDRSSFVKLLDFVDCFPHYFIGQNADLPIVGGSILTHDHMQGGHYTFAMAKAPIEDTISFEGFSDVEAGIVKWPMSVIRLRSTDKKRLVELADKILLAWRSYTDADAFIFAETDGEPHNTITPIARVRDGVFELDLVLRNNITTQEHPLGLYHPHAELHNIKKENIGLIEVMGLAVLPSRLKKEMDLMCEYITEGKDFASDPSLAKHKSWFEGFKNNYKFTKENVRSVIEDEVGKTFIRVLEDAGVYKRTDSGKKAFLKFIASV